MVAKIDQVTEAKTPMASVQTEKKFSLQKNSLNVSNL